MVRFYLNKESLEKYCKPEVIFETNGRKLELNDKNIVEYESRDGILPRFLFYDKKTGEIYIPSEEELKKKKLI